MSISPRPESGHQYTWQRRARNRSVQSRPVTCATLRRLCDSRPSLRFLQNLALDSKSSDAHNPRTEIFLNWSGESDSHSQSLGPTALMSNSHELLCRYRRGDLFLSGGYWADALERSLQAAEFLVLIRNSHSNGVDLLRSAAHSLCLVS